MAFPKTLAILLIALAPALSCQETSISKQEAPSPDSIDLLFKEYYETGKELFPYSATSEGDRRYNHLMHNSLTQSHRDRVAAYYRGFLDRLLAYNRESLSDMDRVSYDVLQWECEINLENQALPGHLLPVSQLYSLPVSLASLASGSGMQPFETVRDYDNWLRRLETFPEAVDTAIAYMRLGMETGYVQPAVLIEKTLPQYAGFDQGPVEEHLYYRPVAHMPDSFPQADRERLEQAYRERIEQVVIPTYARMHAFLRDEYLPACRAEAGMHALPRGREMYDHYIRYYTTTTLSADSIFELGLREVARIRGEMEALKARVGFEGSLREFFDYVRTSEDLLVYTDPQQVIDNFEAMYDKIKPKLPELFSKVPQAAFEIRRTEAFREATASWEYMEPSRDGSRPGIFYVPIPDVRKYNGYSDENTFLHEAIPGHHYQIALQMENDSLPDFRKGLWYSAYGEGWALYTESMGEALGLYQDPYQYFGGLSWDMHRAIRLVVDVGMHVKGWTREQAIQYSLENEAEPEHTIISEIERYMANPGQALSYKIGQLKIMELRDRAEKALGEDFDIRDFHTAVLETGCVPLQSLEQHIDDWVACRSMP